MIIYTHILIHYVTPKFYSHRQKIIILSQFCCYNSFKQRNFRLFRFLDDQIVLDQPGGDVVEAGVGQTVVVVDQVVGVVVS